MKKRGLQKRFEVEQGDHHGRGLVSYAEFITRLFAFFVVMYALSSRSGGKYKVLAESMEKAFKEQEGNVLRVTDPIQVGEIPRSVSASSILEGGAEELVMLEKISEQIEEVMAPYIDEDLVAVEHHRFWVVVEMKSSLLFPSGSAELGSGADAVLGKLAEIVRQMPANPVTIEGHTDNVPIHTPRFPSNWELSAARAASVVRRLAAQGIAQPRLAAVGYGEYHPVADNSTPQGRNRNRRVVMVLQARNMARYQVMTNGREKAVPAETEAMSEAR